MASCHPSRLNPANWKQAEPRAYERRCSTSPCHRQARYELKRATSGRIYSHALCAACAVQLPPALRPTELWTPERGFIKGMW